MRGIITLAAALALPHDGVEFPHRDLILLTAFAVVFGTLVLQGLTLKPLIRVLRLEDDDPVGRETRPRRERALEAALATLDGDASPAAEAVRQEFAAHLSSSGATAERVDGAGTHGEIHRRALDAARRAVLEMRDRDDIGDDAFHRLEEELDWVEMGVRTTGPS